MLAFQGQILEFWNEIQESDVKMFLGGSFQFLYHLHCLQITSG